MRSLTRKHYKTPLVLTLQNYAFRLGRMHATQNMATFEIGINSIRCFPFNVKALNGLDCTWGRWHWWSDAPSNWAYRIRAILSCPPDWCKRVGTNALFLSLHFHQNPMGISIKIEIEVSWCELASHAIVAVAAARSILLQMRGSEAILTLSCEILGPSRGSQWAIFGLPGVKS